MPKLTVVFNIPDDLSPDLVPAVPVAREIAEGFNDSDPAIPITVAEARWGNHLAR